MDREIGPVDRQEIDKPGAESDSNPRVHELPSRDKQPLIGRNYAYFLSQAELETIKDIGRFRTVAIDDLSRLRYRNHDQFREDLRSLQEQGLVSRRTIWTGMRTDRRASARKPADARSADHLAVLVLTKKGKALLAERGGGLDQQKMYSGFVKAREVRHDAAIYRMYHAEAAKIERSGGSIRRVVLDYELKQKVYRPMAKARAKSGSAKTPEYARQQTEIARQNQLKVVGGKILLPDLRIEYETANGERAHVDLELATHHYRGASMLAKAAAGFKMYAPQGSALGRSVAYDPELVAEIFSF